MEILTQVLLLLLVAKIAGWLAQRVGQPAMVGEILGGMVLALIIALSAWQIPIVSDLPNSQVAEYGMQIGIFSLVLSAGIDIEPAEIRKRSGPSFFVAIGGLLLPLALGAGLAWIVIPDGQLKMAQALLVGITLSITAVPATVAMLTELNLTHKTTGETILAAAIFDDVIGLFLLAILLAVMEAGHVPSLIDFALLVLKVAAFFGVTIGLGVRVYPAVQKRMRALDLAAVEFSALVLVALFYAVLAELLGMHWMMGVFMAGLFFEPHRVGELAHSEMKIIASGISAGVFGPIFFTVIGLWVSYEVILNAPFLVIGFITVAILGKVIGCGVPARLSGLDGRDSLIVGFGMCSKGAIELIVLSIAREGGLFVDAGRDGTVVSELYSALVMMAIVVTLLTPVLLRLPRNKAAHDDV